MIVVYTSSTCPKCAVLKKKLASKNLEYDECTDTAKMQSMGIQSLPMLDFGDGSLLTFKEAVEYIDGRKMHGYSAEIIQGL
jgi:glutaredoxin-related protein